MPLGRYLGKQLSPLCTNEPRSAVENTIAKWLEMVTRWRHQCLARPHLVPQLDLYQSGLTFQFLWAIGRDRLTTVPGS